jgi:hypothetical protein
MELWPSIWLARQERTPLKSSGKITVNAVRNRLVMTIRNMQYSLTSSLRHEIVVSVQRFCCTKFGRLLQFGIWLNNFWRFWIHEVGGWTEGRDLNFDIWIRSCCPGYWYFFSEPELNGSVILNIRSKFIRSDFIRSKFIQVKIYTVQNLYGQFLYFFKFGSDTQISSYKNVLQIRSRKGTHQFGTAVPGVSMI